MTLDGNDVGEDGARALAAALRDGGGRALATLDLGYNHLTADGAAALADALAADGGAPALHTLWLGSNGVADDGARALARMLRTNTRLRALGLWNNGVGCDGGDALERALRVNRALTQLFLAHNAADDSEELRGKIGAALERNAKAARLTGEELGSLERDEL